MKNPQILIQDRLGNTVLDVGLWQLIALYAFSGDISQARGLDNLLISLNGEQIEMPEEFKNEE